MFCAADFKSRCDPIITNLDPDGIIEASVLVSDVIRLHKKHPLLFLPDFVEDMINGMYSRKMMIKYHMHNYNDFMLASSTLKLNGQRSKNYKDCREENLKRRGWGQQYNILTSQFKLFRPQLVDMFNCSVLRTLVAHAVLRLQYISYDNLETSVLESYDALKSSLHMPHDAAFDGYIEDGLARKIDSDITQMAQGSLLTSIEGDVSIPAKYAHARLWMLNTIERSRGGIQYQSLVAKALREFPLLRMLPGRHEIDGMLDGLERDGSIICKRAFWKFAPYSNQIFSTDVYRVSVERMKAHAVSTGRTRFFGRRITPARFVLEIMTLEIGDLDDRDDQVTRIAGLVLSDTALLQNPAEHVPGFDFVADFTNYNFRPEQKDMMRRLDFVVRSKTVHCKVAINDEITVQSVGELSKVIPDGDQGVVFTCIPVNPAVRRQTQDDRTIQIIDEAGIRAWCALTSTMPCRLNSVARVMYGDSRGKAVMVKSVNYESGMAIVEAVPDREEVTLPIGCLEEISPDVGVPTNAESESFVRMEADFTAASEEYFGFLCDLASLSQDSFEEGLVLNVRAVHMTRLDLMKSIKPEMFDGPDPDIDIHKEIQPDRYVEFKNGIYSTVTMPSFTTSIAFVCECSHRLNETYRFTLCSHLVSAIIRLVIGEYDDWESAKRRIHAFREALGAFRRNNVTRVLSAFRDVVGGGSEQFLKEYILSQLLESDDEREEGYANTNGMSSSDAEKHLHDLLGNDSEMLKLLETLKVDIARLDEILLRRVISSLYG